MIEQNLKANQGIREFVRSQYELDNTSPSNFYLKLTSYLFIFFQNFPFFLSLFQLIYFIYYFCLSIGSIKPLLIVLRLLTL